MKWQEHLKHQYRIENTRTGEILEAVYVGSRPSVIRGLTYHEYYPKGRRHENFVYNSTDCVATHTPYRLIPPDINWIMEDGG